MLEETSLQLMRTSSNDIRRGNMGAHHPSKEQASSRTNKDGKEYVKYVSVSEVFFSFRDTGALDTIIVGTNGNVRRLSLITLALFHFRCQLLYPKSASMRRTRSFVFRNRTSTS